MTDTTTPKPEGLRGFLWPIYGLEHKKFLPMTMMIALILFNYTVLRNMKDTLVVDAAKGSEIITALKLYMVLPSAVIAFLIITKLYNMFSKENVFYIIITFFIGFFALFALVLYPHQEFFQPVQSAAWLRETLPDSKYWETLINIYQYWTYSLFYIFSELWGSVVASLLFWQFANSVVKVTEAKRFYAHFYLVANLATALAGQMSRVFSGFGNNLPTEFERYGVTINWTVWTVVGVGLVVLVLYRYLNQVIVPDPRLVSTDEAKPSKKKLKLSMGESIKFIFSSKYLGLIALLVISYGISINLVEVAWKHEIKMLHPGKSDYNAYMGMISSIIGLATFFVILIGGYFIRVLGWRFAALLTPLMLGVTGLAFFYFFIFEDSVSPIAAQLGTSVVAMTVLFGSIQNVLSKSTKYALFDPTKEMAYIPLDAESKAKGKAAVDVVGGRLGKAGGAGLQEFIKLVTGFSVVQYAPISAALVAGIVVIWLFAVVNLHKRFVAAGGEEK